MNVGGRSQRHISRLAAGELPAATSWVMTKSGHDIVSSHDTLSLFCMVS